MLGTKLVLPAMEAPAEVLDSVGIRTDRGPDELAAPRLPQGDALICNALPVSGQCEGSEFIGVYLETTIILKGAPIDQAVSWVTDVEVTVKTYNVLVEWEMT